jgi:hypothetical protein
VVSAAEPYPIRLIPRAPKLRRACPEFAERGWRMERDGGREACAILVLNRLFLFTHIELFHSHRSYQGIF